MEDNGILLADGRIISCNLAVSATGSEAQTIILSSNLEVLDGYFRVNDYLHSSSHSNFFDGGDCITM